MMIMQVEINMSVIGYGMFWCVLVWGGLYIIIFNILYYILYYSILL
jgi:hypothetical protein